MTRWYGDCTSSFENFSSVLRNAPEWVRTTVISLDKKIQSIHLFMSRSVSSRLSFIFCLGNQVIQQKGEECDHIKFLIEEKESEEEAFYEDLDGFEENGTQETRISPYTFCKAFPFHLMFDKDLTLTQCGNAIFRVLPQVIPSRDIIQM